MKHLAIVCLITLIVSGFASVLQINPTYAATVSGIISSNTTWTPDNSPYDLTGNVLVNDGVTLTVEPGVTVNLGSYYIMVNGTLNAKGSNSNPIYFNGGQVTFTQYSTNWNESTGTGCIIQNAVLSSSTSIEGGGLNISNNTVTNAISIDGGNPIISNNTIMGQGISLGFESKNSTISNNVISGCQAGIAILLDYDSNSIIQGNLIVNNANGISIFSWPTPDSGCPVIRNNTITNNLNGLRLSSLGNQLSPTILNNNIYNNSNYNIVLEIPNNVNASYNWWGTADTQAIEQSIYDYYDAFTLGKVAYTPFLTAENVIPEFPSNLLMVLIVIFLSSGALFSRKKIRRD